MQKRRVFIRKTRLIFSISLFYIKSTVMKNEEMIAFGRQSSLVFIKW